MEKSELKAKIYSKIEELPTLPAMIPKLLQLTESRKSSVSDLTALIERDPALASKILKVANSAYYGFSQKISDLERAIALLGFNMVKSLALSIGVIRSLPTGRKHQSFSVEGLWLHSLAVAVLIQELGKRYRKGEENEHLFVVGLLHDVGKIVFFHFFYDEFEQALNLIVNDGTKKLHLVEREMIGIDHCEVAAMLLTRWRFPLTIVNPVAYHHEHDIPGDTNAEDVSLLRIANILGQELAIGEEGNSTPNEIHPSDCVLLKIDEAGLGEMRAYARGAHDDIHSFFSALHQ